MSLWDELHRHALLGTVRSDSPTLGGEGALAAALATGASLAPETYLLHAAALLGRHRRLGSQPPHETTLPPPSPAETLTAATTAQIHLLRVLLRDPQPALLDDYLIGLAGQGCRVPADTLPVLLNGATQRPVIAKALAICGGERGRWLAGLNPAWATLLALVDPEEVWRSGSSQQRLELLTTERRRDPEAARERLLAGFAQEAPQDRQAFIDVLGLELRPADGPFLEDCLQDRSQAVRFQASRWLVRLGDNPTAEAIANIVGGFFQHSSGLIRRRLTVQLPEHYAKSWSRFGLKESPPASRRLGKRVWWLYQWLGLFGPSRLAGLLQLDLDWMVAQLAKTDVAKECRQSLEEAVLPVADRAYVEWRLTTGLAEACCDALVDFGELLSPADYQYWLQQCLATTDHDAQAWWRLVLAATAWSPATTEALIAVLPAQLKAWSRRPSHGASLADLALRLSPGFAEALLNACHPYLELPAVAELTRVYELRCRIHSTLESSP